MRRTMSWMLLVAVAASLNVVAAVLPDVAEYRYNNGLLATGGFTGSCDAAGLHANLNQAGSVDIRHRGGMLTVYETRINETLIAPDEQPPISYWDAPTLEAFPQRLAEGTLHLEWGIHDHLHAHATDRNVTGALRVRLDGPQWDSGPVAQSHAYGVPYGERVDGAVIMMDQAIPGWSRAVRVPGPAHPVNGDLVVKLDGARLEGVDLDVQLPPYFASKNETDLRPVLYKHTVVLTHAVLELRETSFALDSEVFSLYCAGLSVTGEGSVLFRNAHGVVTRGSETLPFERRELSIHGTVSISEKPEAFEHTLTSEGWIRGHATGRFEVVGLDFAPARLGAGGWPEAAATIGILALVLGGLASLTQSGRLVGFFFSRFDPASAPKHPARTRILEVVNAHPGIAMRRLAVEAHVNYSVLRHHLRVLQVVGLVKTLRSHHTKHVYPRNESLAVARKALLEERDQLVAFLQAEAQRGPLERRRAGQLLRERFGVSRVGAWKAVRRAARTGLVQIEATPGGDVLRPVGRPRAIPS